MVFARAIRFAAVVVLGACRAGDVDFTDVVRITGRITDQQGTRVAGAAVSVATFATSCTGAVQAFGQASTDSSGRFSLTVGSTAGKRFEGCVEVTATPGIGTPFDRVVLQLDSVRIDNLLRDSVYADVRVSRGTISSN